MNKIKVVETSIQVDNQGEHRIVYLDETGVEWVIAVQGKDTHGRITRLIPKREAFFFREYIGKY